MISGFKYLRPKGYRMPCMIVGSLMGMQAAMDGTEVQER
jgi:hypothetical protein